MIKLKDLGNFETVPKILEYVINEDIESLNQHKENGWNINQTVNVSKYISISPLSCALIMEKFSSVQWLVENGVDLNDQESPAFLEAVRYCDEEIVQYIAAQGANVNAVNRVRSDAFQQALCGDKITNLPVIQELGHTVRKYGGFAFRKAVWERNYPVIKFFIENGVDINFNKPDQVYPYSPTALCVAARYTDLEMCKFLVGQGAEVILGEKDSMRPYSIALEKGDIDMAEYFKSLEPVEFHNLQNRLDELKKFKLPKGLLDFLKGDNLRLEVKDSEHIKFIKFFNIIDVVIMKYGRKSLLRISRETDNYSDIIFVWNPKDKKIAAYDFEHGELTNLSSFDEFVKNSGLLIDTKLF